MVVVAEPSLESVNLAERIKELTSGAGAKFAGAVLNKVSGEEIAARLTEALERRGIPLLSTIPFRQEFLQAALKGRPLDAAPVAAELQSLLDSILTVAETKASN